MGGSYRHQAAAHVGVRHREAGLVDGLLKDQVDDSLQPLLRVHRQVCHLLHELVEHLGRQLVQDASYLPEQLLNDTNTEVQAQVLQRDFRNELGFF